MEKLAAHKGRGVLHRAVSVLLYRKNKGHIEVLLQKRAKNKPLWPLFWSNTVCTHPRDGETNTDCAVRRLREEMGIEVSSDALTFIGKFLYQAQYIKDLSEHELDHVFTGRWNGVVLLNKEEASGYEWKILDDLVVNMQKNPSQYTPWFLKMILEIKLLLSD